MNPGTQDFLNLIQQDPELRRILTGVDLKELLEVAARRGYSFSRDELLDTLREHFQSSDEPDVILPLGE